MAQGDVQITVVGNLVADPELKLHPKRRSRGFLPGRLHAAGFSRRPVG